MLVSTLVPLALVLALGAMAVAVVRARHRRNVGESRVAPCPPPPTPWVGGCHVLSSFINSRRGSGEAGWGKINPQVPQTYMKCCYLWKATPRWLRSKFRGRAAKEDSRVLGHLHFQPHLRTDWMCDFGCPISHLMVQDRDHHTTSEG